MINFSQIKIRAFSETPRQTYFHKKHGDKQGIPLEVSWFTTAKQHYFDKFQRNSYGNPSPKMDFASGFRNDNGLPVHIYEWVSEWKNDSDIMFFWWSNPLAKLQIDIKRVSSWRKSSDFCSTHMNFINWCEFHEFPVFLFSFLFLSISKRHETPHNKNVLGFVICLSMTTYDL